MKVKTYLRKFGLLYLAVAALLLFVSVVGSHTVTVFTELLPIERQHIFIIDAGHGGEDGGAISCAGVLESKINLDIALRLNELMHLLGMETVMIRTTDISVYTQGETIAAKKASDLKERVRIVNGTKNGVLISIHQNSFPDSQFYGAQVFYAGDPQSAALANTMQKQFVATVNRGSSRKAKEADGVYLMEHAACTSLLIECGFLSNAEEEAKLRSDSYQKALCCVIAATLSTNIRGAL